MAFTVSQAVDRRGLCTRCTHLTSRRFDNGDQYFECGKDGKALRKVVVECSDFSPKGSDIFGSAAWTITVRPEDGEVRFRDSNYNHFKIVRKGRSKRETVSIVKVKPKDEDND